MHDNHYFQVAIIGGGISGSSLLYTLARYSDISSIALFEKYDEIGSVNTNAKSNSQTLHCGDIETNYTLEKAKKVKRTAKMLEKYALQYGYGGKHMHKVTKMALGVGADEVAYIKKRYAEFVSFFPYMELWDEAALAEIEPSLLEGREEPIIAMGAKDEYSAVDFGAIAESFVENAQKEPNKETELFLNTEITSMERKGDKIILQCDAGQYFADFVVVNAGAHSLLLAHEMGLPADRRELLLCQEEHLELQGLYGAKPEAPLCRGAWRPRYRQRRYRPFRSDGAGAAETGAVPCKPFRGLPEYIESG